MNDVLVGFLTLVGVVIGWGIVMSVYWWRDRREARRVAERMRYADQFRYRGWQ